MLDFKAIEVSDLPTVKSIVEGTGYRSCQLSAGSLYCLSGKYGTQVCFSHGYLFVKQQRKCFGTCYFMPVGAGSLAQALEALRHYHARHHGSPLVLWGIADDMAEDFRKAGQPYASVALTPDRDWAEYIHTTHNLLTLQGKRLQPKRNAVNQFRRRHSGYRYEPLSEANVDAILAFQQQQMTQKDEELNEALQDEHQAIVRTLRDFRAIGLTGGAIRVEGEVRAFAVGCPINATSFDILFEKADKSYNGIYQVVEQELIKNELPHFTHINREEDLGIPGVRFAKQGLHPDMLLMKHSTVLPPL